MEEKRPYEATIDFSRQRSLEKALLIIEKEHQEYEQDRLQKLARPNTSPIKGILVLLCVLIAYIVVLLVSNKLADCCNVPIRAVSIVVLTIAALMLFLIKSKPIIIYCVKLYQRYAPNRLRLSCVFEPSCSEYMIAVVEKYGTVKGISKGIHRLLRCHPPNGGKDNP